MTDSHKRLIYTALIGDYEQFQGPTLDVNENTDLVCFTDNPNLRSDHWKIKVVTPRFPQDNIRSARYLKIQGPKFNVEYDESLWIDNTVLLKKSPESLFEKYLTDHDMALPRHSYRTSVAAEFDAVDASGFDDVNRIYEQMLHYIKINPGTLDEKPYWTAILLRKHNQVVFELMDAWWEHVLRYSRRDQLSLNYVISVMAERGLRMNELEIDNQSSDFHQWPVNTCRKVKLSRTSTFYDHYKDIPQVKIGRLENENQLLKKKLGKKKNKFWKKLLSK